MYHHQSTLINLPAIDVPPSFILVLSPGLLVRDDRKLEKELVVCGGAFQATALAR
jgi:hypothetical protein